MEWLNYHHLLYFWMVAREGGVSKAAEKLRISQPTVSAQVKRLERALGERLLERQGRTVTLTEAGRVVYRYADEIFALGRELRETLRGRPSAGAAQLTVGVADTGAGLRGESGSGEAVGDVRAHQGLRSVSIPIGHQGHETVVLLEVTRAGFASWR